MSDKTVPVSEAVNHVKSHDHLVLAGMCGEPPTLIQELIQQRERLENVTIYNMPLGTPCEYANPEWDRHFKVKSVLLSGALKDSYKSGMTDYLPMNLFDIPGYMEQLRPNVAFIQCTPSDSEGNVNLGLSADYTLSLIKHAQLVIAEINDQLPWVNGKGTISSAEIDVFVEGSIPPNELPSATPGETENKIAQYVATLIPDRSTIQIGIGSLANSIISALKNKSALGVHTGTFPEELIELYKSGVVTNEHKEINQGKIVATCLAGTQTLYNYANRHSDIELHPSDYTHSTTTISQLSNFHAINSAVQVDLTGQINAEKIKDFYIAGVGGQMDFMRGAMASKGGKSIIALPSTAAKGTKSRIVPELSSVTSTKSDVHYVVTEYGIASLYGKTIAERKEELISITHPDFRDEL
ncbi:acetyl-CoA hydrolase/transferase family protein [Salicibibacter halophilus]|uniref:Acetyl-CoA hydrolase/transferase family protein n=1 Tax=Salicibibacter halophilus TaxID=2502791 RepID=A0A514LEQ0_9BACI|nr:acetyl-CoA hydrolase/transferase C-terminal domain-containing protein [Salicibibacter halophilus]QDI90328.1 acetyl-CoA hydrolase/transferase family protein [Salicibibacter halophilus]